MNTNKLTPHKCNRCHHKWISRTTELPRVCASCKNAYWNSPRKFMYDWHKAREQKRRELERDDGEQYRERVNKILVKR